MNVETAVTPPEAQEEPNGDERWTRVMVSLSRYDGMCFDAGVSLHAAQVDDPEKIADAVLGAALAMASLAGPEVSWAVVQRLARYQGGTP